MRAGCITEQEREMISKFRCFLILSFVSITLLVLFSFIVAYGGVQRQVQFYWTDSKNGLHLEAVSLSRVDEMTPDIRRFLAEEKRTTVQGNYQGVEKESNQARTVFTGGNYPDGVSSFAPGRLGVSNNEHLQVASKSHLLLYAAYYDDVRKPATITIVGIRSSSFSSQSVNCSFSNTRNDKPGNTTLFNSTAGRVTDLPDHHSSLYRPVYIFCPLSEAKSRPDQVSVVCQNDSVPNLLQITYPYQGPYRYQFSMCVSPVYGAYNIWQQTLESMEMAQMLGVDHVNIYVDKAGGNLTRILQYYVDQGFMSVLPWNDIPSQIHARAQVGCMHDCLLRMRYVSKYVVFIDLDELIILRTNNTLREMVDHVLKQTKDADKVGAIMVRNSFFHRTPQEKLNITDSYLQANLTIELFAKAHQYDLKSVFMQFRGKPWNPPQRCRTIADPLKVNTMAVHHPETMFNDFKVIVVDPEIGLLHHYRYGWHNEDTVRDTTAHRLTPILVKRLDAVYRQLGLQLTDEHRR